MFYKLQRLLIKGALTVRGQFRMSTMCSSNYHMVGSEETKKSETERVSERVRSSFCQQGVGGGGGARGRRGGRRGEVGGGATESAGWRETHHNSFTVGL